MLGEHVYKLADFDVPGPRSPLQSAFNPAIVARLGHQGNDCCGHLQIITCPPTLKPLKETPLAPVPLPYPAPRNRRWPESVSRRDRRLIRKFPSEGHSFKRNIHSRHLGYVLLRLLEGLLRHVPLTDTLKGVMNLSADGQESISSIDDFPARGMVIFIGRAVYGAGRM